MSHSNVQVFFLRVTDNRKRVFIVGTNTQRGFTIDSVKKALNRATARLPVGWSVEVISVHPLSALLYAP
jgi:hypothetical protein